MLERGKKVWPSIRKMLTGVILVVLVVFFSGCGEDSTQPRPSKQVVAKPKTASPKPKVEGKPKPAVFPIQPDYRYQVGDRRDPFRSILVAPDGEKSFADLPPLQRAEIEELRVIGIIWGEMGYSAMIRTADGKGYTIQVGTLVGRNRGKVKKITKNYLMIRERFTDVFGERKTREVRLDLHPQKEGSE